MQYLYCICASLTVAAVHTIIETSIDRTLRPAIPGPVTESGQLALVIPCTLFLLLNLYKRASDKIQELDFQRSFSTLIYYLVLFFSVLLICWPNEFCRNGSLCAASTARIAGILLGLSMILLPIVQKKGVDFKFHLLSISSVLIVSAMLINLKRGPWFGLFAAILVMGIILPRKIIFSCLLLGAVLVLALSPSRHRLKELPEHFTISGGRAMMWEVGVELTKRYPLGLGLKNAKYMQKFDPSFPPSHRHLHNNFLNIVVETGWLGLITYIWWMLTVLALAYNSFKTTNHSSDTRKKNLGMLSFTLGCSLLAWQIAGTVEYNFGDSEIRLIAFVFIGLLITISSALAANKSNQSKSIKA
jgi:O-antigen ligase